ncbi:MAG: phage tail protein [Pseudomonadota bacterium]|nr:phage tail protein [Pseudomonadota bacterium]
MIKPTDLRQHLTAALPDLARDPDRLIIFMRDGQLIATAVPGLSFEYRYTLALLVTDYSGEPDALMVPVLEWLSRHQPELFANPDLRQNIRFEAEVLSNAAVDIEITLPLTERVGVHPRAGGGMTIEHYPEPVIETTMRPGRWDVYLRDEWISGWDVPANE